MKTKKTIEQREVELRAMKAELESQEVKQIGNMVYPTKAQWDMMFKYTNALKRYAKLIGYNTTAAEAKLSGKIS